MTSILNENALDNNGEDDNENEETIVEESLEDIILIFSKLSAVDFVEDLHEHERVEDQSVVFNLVHVGNYYTVNSRVEFLFLIVM